MTVIFPTFDPAALALERDLTGEMSEEKGGAIGGAIDLTERQAEIVRLILDDRKISCCQMAATLEVNESAIIKHIKNLREKGVLKSIGGTRGRWEVLK